MDNSFFSPFLLSLKLAVITTVLLFVIGLPIAYFLAYRQFRLKIVLQSLISMPLVLPPSVLGFYLLVAFSPEHWLGKTLNDFFSVQLVFSFAGILVASLIFNFPFMINALQTGFSSVPESLREASYTLGKSEFITLWKIILPNMRPAIITGLCITFAHTIGEFGVILMIGGNIPDKTRVASIAIYDEVQALNFDKANEYALFLFVFSFLMLLLVYSINKDYHRWKKF
ncbi:MAG: molybdate ABC transporter permease subunit [Ignavibacteria bacterium]|nr:molybdate ABC transporter permease subunit [Ignavibacteria bacterium]